MMSGCCYWNSLVIKKTKQNKKNTHTKKTCLCQTCSAACKKPDREPRVHVGTECKKKKERKKERKERQFHSEVSVVVNVRVGNMTGKEGGGWSCSIKRLVCRWTARRSSGGMCLSVRLPPSFVMMMIGQRHDWLCPVWSCWFLGVEVGWAQGDGHTHTHTHTHTQNLHDNWLWNLSLSVECLDLRQYPHPVAGHE